MGGAGAGARPAPARRGVTRCSSSWHGANSAPGALREGQGVPWAFIEAVDVHPAAVHTQGAQGGGQALQVEQPNPHKLQAVQVRQAGHLPCIKFWRMAPSSADIGLVERLQAQLLRGKGGGGRGRRFLAGPRRMRLDRPLAQGAGSALRGVAAAGTALHR